MIVVVDFGSQTAHLIGRRIRDLGVEHIIIEPNEAYETIKKTSPQGIILSGGPSSVYELGAPTVNVRIFELGVPILGICYGWQLTAHLLKGNVLQGNHEYGPTKITIDKVNPLFRNIKSEKLDVWMSHGDEVVELPAGFSYCAYSAGVKAAGVANFDRHIFGVQFHPEVEHTKEGITILRNFLELVCGLKTKTRKIDIDGLIKSIRENADAIDPSARAIAAVSGGVDSSVASAIVAKALGERFTPIFCDNGLMRLGTAEEVELIFHDMLKVKPIILECRKDFLRVLKRITDPEEKRMKIGAMYIEMFDKAAKKEKNVRFLVQGTIFSDVIESGASATGKHSSKIKSHHNVGALPADMNLSLIEPLRSFYKDEVRQIGRELGLPDWIVNKQPFPGPGHAIRIIGEITEKRLEKQQLADQIVVQVIKEEGWYDKVYESFSIMTGINSTAVKGDGRVYSEVVALRICESHDIMTADWTRIPYDILQKISSRIVNEVPEVSRVVYDITTKPPATIGWE